MCPQGQRAHYLPKKNSGWIQVFNGSLNHEMVDAACKTSKCLTHNIVLYSLIKACRVCMLDAIFVWLLCSVVLKSSLARVLVSQVPRCVCEPSTPGALSNGKALPVWPFTPSKLAGSSHTCLGAYAFKDSMVFPKIFPLKRKKCPYPKRSFGLYLKKKKKKKIYAEDVKLLM